tara:strand:+ start:456 stop:887 length:432 start_codon:yes stop_codon:yes gene_type:complete
VGGVLLATNASSSAGGSSSAAYRLLQVSRNTKNSPTQSPVVQKKIWRREKEKKKKSQQQHNKVKINVDLKNPNFYSPKQLACPSQRLHIATPFIIVVIAEPNFPQTPLRKTSDKNILTSACVDKKVATSRILSSIPPSTESSK